MCQKCSKKCKKCHEECQNQLYTICISCSENIIKNLIFCKFCNKFYCKQCIMKCSSCKEYNSCSNCCTYCCNSNCDIISCPLHVDKILKNDCQCRTGKTCSDCENY